jgi:hypothetical protein
MGLFHSLFYHCPEAVHNVVKAEEGQLGPLDKLRLKVHLAYCKACAVFAEQSALIRQAMPDALKNAAGARLSDAEKRQLEEQLK